MTPLSHTQTYIESFSSNRPADELLIFILMKKLFLFLLVNSCFLFSALGDNSSSFMQFIDGDIEFSKQESCFEKLTCEDKIILSGLTEDLKKFKSPKIAFIYLRDKIKKLPELQQVRITTALNVSFLRGQQIISPEIKIRLAKAIEESKTVQAYLNNYLSSVEQFYLTINKIKENPHGSYLLYSLADRPNWQGKLLNFFVDVPNFDDTPLGFSLEWVRKAKSDFAGEFTHYLDRIHVGSIEKRIFTQKLKDELQKQWNEIERQVAVADSVILGSANSVKKSYQMVLSATIIAATMGSAGPAVFALNGAGLYLAADSAIDLSESYLEAYGDGGPGDFFCAFAQNNIDNYEVENVFMNAAIGGGMAFIFGGLFHTMFKAKSKLATIGATSVVFGGMSYAAYSTIAVPVEEAIKIQEVRIAAKEAGDDELYQCLGVAQKKLASGSVINVGALLLSLRGIGEANFSTPAGVGGAQFKLNSLIRKYTRGNISNKETVVKDAFKLSITSRGPPRGKLNRVHQSARASRLDGAIYEGRLVNTKYFLKKLETTRVARSIDRLKIYLQDRGFASYRQYRIPKLDNVANRDVIIRMYRELQDQFQSEEFLLTNFKRLFSEYELYIRKHAEPIPNQSFLDVWRGFIRFVGKNEKLEIVVLENRFYSSQEFRALIGKNMLFDEAFSKNTHGLTTHALQVLFITRHFRELGVPEKYIDEFFVTFKDLDQDNWGEFFDGFSQNLTSPENVNIFFRAMKFDRGASGI